MDIFSLCNLKTQITILKLTQIPRIFHVFQSGIIKRCNDFIGIIRRTIIHNNNFDMRVGLIQCTFNSPIHHICPIICWYANRDKCSIIHVNINLSSIIASLGQKVFSYLEYRIHLSGEGFVCFIIRLHFLRKRGNFNNKSSLLRYRNVYSLLNPINFVHLKISIVGGGYVGLVSAVCFAELGYSVVIIEKDPQKVKSINDGIPPIYETGLETYLKSNVKKNLTASASYHEILNTDITIICVGTPDREDGSANLDYISQASESIGDILQDKGTNHLILVKSTVPPGTTQNLVIPITRSASKNNKNLSFGVNPEFLREAGRLKIFSIRIDCDWL